MDDNKCRICGGDLANDYISGTCFCTHCGNKSPLAEADAHYADYEHIIKQLKSAEAADMSGKNDLKLTEQALLMYKNALTACSLSKPMPQVEEIKKLCREKADICALRRKYLAAKEHFENKAYSKAYDELKELKDYEDAEELIAKCGEEIEKERKKRIPYSIGVGLILPAILFFFLREKYDVALAPIFAVSLIAAGLDIFVIYRGGALAALVEVLSFVLLVPLLLFALLAYVLHLPVKTAAVAAVVLPVVIAVIVVIIAERD